MPEWWGWRWGAHLWAPLPRQPALSASSKTHFQDRNPRGWGGFLKVISILNCRAKVWLLPYYLPSLGRRAEPMAFLPSPSPLRILTYQVASGRQQ